MAEFDLFDKARKAREQASAAAARAAELAGQASVRAADLKDSVASTAQDVKDTLAAAATDLREASVAKVKETLADFNSAVPVLREMGYALSEVTLSLGMPPSLVATFLVSHEVNEETVHRALEENASRKLTVFLVRTLSQAHKLQTSVEVAGMKPRGIVVELGLSPSVAIKFA
jgi:hypothetical protein